MKMPPLLDQTQEQHERTEDRGVHGEHPESTGPQETEEEMHAQQSGDQCGSGACQIGDGGLSYTIDHPGDLQQTGAADRGQGEKKGEARRSWRGRVPGRYRRRWWSPTG